MDDPKQLPSLKEMVYGLSETVQNMLKTAAQHKIVLVTEEQALARLDICLACEHFITQPENSIIPARCGKCGCGMKYKARIAAAHCPIQKWGPITSK
jgi:hypothetical protein